MSFDAFKNTFSPEDNGYISVSPYELENTNPYREIGKEWMLIVSADENGRANAMTASWGCVGVLWNKPVAICFVRPQRYTFENTEKSDRFSLCFLGKGHKDVHSVCGKESGRNADKIKKSGLVSEFCDGAPVISGSEMILVCRKLYSDLLKEDKFIDKTLIGANYPEKDFHMMYVCEIVKAYIKK